MILSEKYHNKYCGPFSEGPLFMSYEQSEKRKAYMRNYSKVQRLYTYTFDADERGMLRRAHPTWKLDKEYKLKKRQIAKKYREGPTYKLYVEKNKDKLKAANDKFKATKKYKVYQHEWYLKNRDRTKDSWAEKAKLYRTRNREAYNLWEREYRAEYRKLEKHKIYVRHIWHEKAKKYFDDCQRCSLLKIYYALPKEKRLQMHKKEWVKINQYRYQSPNL